MFSIKQLKKKKKHFNSLKYYFSSNDKISEIDSNESPVCFEQLGKTKNDLFKVLSVS